ncbi:hypothetical protein D3C75_719490 [compost metagenome]
MYIAGPGQHAVTLTACPGTAHQVNDILLTIGLQTIIKALSEIAWIAVPHFQNRTGMVAIIVKIIGAVFRLGFVQPE